MVLNFNSKYGILIGTVTLFGGLLIILRKVPTMYNILIVDDDHGFVSTEYIVYGVLVSIFALFSVICSIVLLFGIVKKRHMLLAPWLVVGLLGAIISSCTALYDIMRHFYARDLLAIIVVIGIQVVLLFPIYNLFVEIRGQNRESSYTHNIESACKNDSKKTIV